MTYTQQAFLGGAWIEIIRTFLQHPYYYSGGRQNSAVGIRLSQKV